jgi:hypothetical protein
MLEYVQMSSDFEFTSAHPQGTREDGEEASRYQPERASATEGTAAALQRHSGFYSCAVAYMSFFHL